MNRKMVLYTTGQILGVEALCLLLSALVALLYHEPRAMIALLISAGAAAGLFLLSLLFRPKDTVFFAKEGFVTVSLSWVALGLIGALPFFISGEIPSFIDSYFETISGLTTTGASILSDVTRLSHGMLFWRSFTHWIGGMGVLVLVLAILPSASGRSIHMARAEMSGPTVGKLVPRMRDTAKLLYVIYLGLTLLLAVLLAAGGMPVFDSILHAFGTAGTGGFSSQPDSIASYSPYIQWVITVFMLLFGVNFNLFYFLLLRRFSAVYKNRELLVYLSILAVSVLMISLDLSLHHVFASAGDTVRQASFQAASVVSTTGYATDNFDNWPAFSRAVIFLLMFCGGCAGSTAGGLKISRLMLLIKVGHNRIRHVLHPRSVKAVKMEGKSVDEETAHGVTAYFAIYILCIALLFLILSLEPFSLESNLSAAISTFNNVGPAFGEANAASSYAAYSVLSKLAMSVAMLLGRLEVYPLLITCSPSTWKK
ncbi:MAG: TrkH family potassium uptake protein [Clostridia bacterium]|nr:TrkH family potassium uptake protein [Clostridia bacterium]